MLPVPDLPPRLIIDWTNKCNLRCSGCLVWGSEDDNKIGSVVGTMDVARGRKLLDEVASAKPLVQPTMWGEPLLIPEFRERIRDMTSRGMTVAMNTNGLTLTDDAAHMLVEEGVSAVFFSIDAVTRETLKVIRGVDKLEKIEAAVFRLLAARGDRDLPRIGVSFTVQDANRTEEEAFIARWSALVDVVRIGQVFADGTFHGPQPKGERKPCPALYTTLAVHNNGQVSLCCLDSFREAVVGDVFKDGVAGVWHGAKLAAARAAHERGDYDDPAVTFCKSCTGWAQHDFEERIEGGFLVRESPVYRYINRLDRMGNWSGRRAATPSFRERACELDSSAIK